MWKFRLLQLCSMVLLAFSVHLGILAYQASLYDLVFVDVVVGLANIVLLYWQEKMISVIRMME